MHLLRDTLSDASPRLLLVEDNPILRHLLGTILTGNGYRVRTASDGRTALAQMDIEVPDVLISDLYMPGMSGFELLPLVKLGFPQVHVIAMSSAFSGVAVPDGVVAHSFYEKATDIRNLLGLIDNRPLASRVA